MRDRAARYARELVGTDEGAEWAGKASTLAREIRDLDMAIRKLGGGS
jgi:hypothetical protein